MRSVYPWTGGKYYEKDTLIKLFPIHRWYGEVFGGSFVILINKPKAEEEFGNDLFSTLVSFWDTLKSGWMTRRLWKLCQWTLDSRYLYQEYMRKSPEELTKIDRAYRFMYLTKFGFSSMMDTYYSPLSHKIGKVKDFIRVWENTTQSLWNYHNRVKKVHFCNYDFQKFLKKMHPHPEKFLFLDPPYLGTHSYDKGYYAEGKFPEERYKDMRDELERHTHGGTKWMITCDRNNPYFDDMSNIIIDYINRRATLNLNKERPFVKTKVIMNYDVRETGSCLEMNEEESGEMMLV
jgi:site-specific DNA-adenine methylase